MQIQPPPSSNEGSSLFRWSEGDPGAHTWQHGKRRSSLGNTGSVQRRGSVQGKKQGRYSLGEAGSITEIGAWTSFAPMVVQQQLIVRCARVGTNGRAVQ